MPDEKLDKLLNDAALWSGYAEAQLGCAVMLHDQGLEPHAVLDALHAAERGLGRAAASVAEFVALAQRDTQPPPAPQRKPGDEADWERDK